MGWVLNNRKHRGRTTSICSKDCSQEARDPICSAGKIGTFDVENPEDMHHARRAIFHYLLPGFMHVWYAVLDGRDGMVFFVGEPNCSIRESINIELAKRCYGMFGRPPDPCYLVDNIGDVKYDLVTRDGKAHRLRVLEFMQ